IVTSGTAATVAVQRETRTIPIIFANVRDPVAQHIVPRPTSRAGTPAPTKPRWEASGLSCSRRSHPGLGGLQSCSIPTRPPHPLICYHLRQRATNEINGLGRNVETSGFWLRLAKPGAGLKGKISA